MSKLDDIKDAVELGMGIAEKIGDAIETAVDFVTDDEPTLDDKLREGEEWPSVALEEAGLKEGHEVLSDEVVKEALEQYQKCIIPMEIVSDPVKDYQAYLKTETDEAIANMIYECSDDMVHLIAEAHRRSMHCYNEYEEITSDEFDIKGIEKVTEFKRG
jgi:hypothetical protein